MSKLGKEQLAKFVDEIEDKIIRFTESENEQISLEACEIWLKYFTRSAMESSVVKYVENMGKEKISG